MRRPPHWRTASGTDGGTRRTCRRTLALVGCGALVATVLAGCSADPTADGSAAGGGSQVINVVAAENTWGSIAAQLGGSHVRVDSIITDPNTDPHDYEASAADARAFAGARLVVLNGVGYDDWAAKLLSADSSPDRTVLDVGTLVGKPAGDNPHLWYGPEYVFAVIDKITALYEQIAPADKAYFAARHAAVESAFAGYRQRLAYIEHHYAGAPVASTESIFQYLAEYLHLDLVTPYAFMKAVAEGNDPPASSVVTFDEQIAHKDFKVLVYNVQTVTPLTTTIKAEAGEKDIPVVGVSETIQPPIASFQDWMDGQLDELANALDATQLGK